MFVTEPYHARPDLTDSVLDMVCTAAQSHGASTAVRCGDREISYASLMVAAEINAVLLREQGVARKDIVLCALGTGIELPVAWLATMMLGAVIVPIDIGWPMLRLRTVVNTTGAAIAIVGDVGHEVLAGAGVRAATIRLEHRNDDTVLVVDSSAVGTDLVYGFFTSGSTGEPKCALNHHAGLTNRFRYMTRRFGQGHVVYQNSAPLFDSSIWQMLWPLTNGSISVLPELRGRWNLDTVVDDISRYGVTMTDFVPTLFKLLVCGLESGRIAPNKLASLCHVLIGGEEIDPPSVHSFRRLLPRCRVINTYGHTEASIGMVFHEVRDEDGLRIPLGKSIDNTYVRIVDSSMRVLADGELGEIVIGGICVGAGYLNLPQLTERSFVANPFPDVPGGIVYRTGDMGRMRADGFLEYAGRADDQVKVHGVRIELGELSQTMKACFREVSDAIALITPAMHGQPELVLAYAAPAEIEACLLRRTLANHLPMTHMPRRVLWLESLPVSPNGKIDRKRIIEIVGAQIQSEAIAATAPEGTASLVETIVHCYRSVLKLNEICLDTDFFDSGGDSLEAVNLSLMLEQTGGITMPITRLYEYSTPRTLAKFVASGSVVLSKQSGLDLPEVEYSNTGGATACSRRVLLTGATGYIGIHVLECLLRTTTLEVSVLLRGTSTQVALDRLATAYRTAHPGQTLPLDRIKVLLGDLGAPRWALPPSVWAHQTVEVDEVIHCGAEVNFLLSASQLFATNVLGTATLIQFCQEGRAKRVHHVSSLAAKPNVVDVYDSAGTTGYGYTKYLADRLIERVQAQGLAARIYRVDDVLPSICAGHVNKQSLVHMLLSYCLRLGVAPAGCGELGMMPVDSLARWLCGFVGTEENFGMAPRLIDVVGKEFIAFDKLVLAVAGKLEREVLPIGYDEFLALLRKSDNPHAALLYGMLPQVGSGRVAFAQPLAFDNRLTMFAAVPNGQQLVASLDDFALYIESLARELDYPGTD